MELADKIALYALGALEPDEAAEFEALVAASPYVQSRLAEERALLRTLHIAPEPVTPSAAATRRLMAHIDGEITPLQQRLDTASRNASAQAQTSGRESSGIWALLRGLGLGLAVISTAAAAFLGYNLVQVQRDMSAMRKEVTDLRSELNITQQTVIQKDQAVSELERASADLRRQLYDAQARIDAAQTQLTQAEGNADKSAQALKNAQAQLSSVQRELAVISQPDVRSAALPASSDNYKQGAVTIFYSPKTNAALVTVANLPALPEGRDYQLWLIEGSNPLPSVIIKVDDKGNGRAVVPSDKVFVNFQAFGVTVEKLGGSPTPNPEGPIYLGKAS
jgi:anti-sigma-K factor RskA